MADIITSQNPVYVGIAQKYTDAGDYHTRVIESVATTDPGTPTGNFVISTHEPPYPNNGDDPPLPLSQRWVDEGDFYARLVKAE